MPAALLVERCMEIDTQKVDEAVLALLYLGLHAQGYISNPVDRSKSVQFTEAGLQASERLCRERFAQ
jgi:hypothetical protein